MFVHTSYFCGLSTSAAFLAWLNNFDPAIYTDLATHLRTGPSCKANTTKMLWVLGQITKHHNGRESLEQFLAATFPHVLTDHNHQESPQEVPVFGHFDSSLLTIPRRAIFDNVVDAEALMAAQAVADHIVVDNIIYVEYLPHDLAHLAESIPSSNWLIAEWRAANLKHNEQETK